MRFGIIPVCCGFEAASRVGGSGPGSPLLAGCFCPPGMWVFVGPAVLCSARSLGSSGGAWPASLLGAGGFLGPRGPVLDMRQGSWCLVRDSGTPTPSSPPRWDEWADIAEMCRLRSRFSWIHLYLPLAPGGHEPDFPPSCADVGDTFVHSILFTVQPPSYYFLPKTSSYCKPHLWMG